MDAAGVVSLLRADGHDIDYERPCPGGEFGASYVSFDAEPCVLKWWPYTDDAAAQLDQSARRIARARDAGFPAPDVVGHGRVEEWLWHVQARLPGELVDDPFDEDLVAQMVDVNTRAAGCAIGEGESCGDQIIQSLRTGLTGWCIHANLRDHSHAAAEVLDRIVAIGELVEPEQLPATDLVHGDYHHRNVLVADGRITGIIDCDSCRDGDHRFDLVTLAYWLGFVGAAPGVADTLTAHTVEVLPSDLLAVYRAHMVLRNIDFYVRTSRPDIATAHVAYGRPLLAL